MVDSVSLRLGASMKLVCSVLLLVGVEVLVLLLVVLLVEEGADEADDEDAEEDPEGAVDLEVGRVHELSLAGPVTGEEESPGAHEEVGSDHGSGEHDDALAELAGDEEANNGHGHGDGPVAPGSIPVAERADQSEEKGTGEETTNGTEESNGDLDVAADENTTDNTEDESDGEDNTSAEASSHPASGERDGADDSDDKDGDDGGNHIGEPAGTEEGDQGSSDQVNDADGPLVVVEPSHGGFDVDTSLVAAGGVLHGDGVSAAVGADGHGFESGVASFGDSLVTSDLADHGVVDGINVTSGSDAHGVGVLGDLNTVDFLVSVTEVLLSSKEDALVSDGSGRFDDPAVTSVLESLAVVELESLASDGLGVLAISFVELGDVEVDTVDEHGVALSKVQGRAGLIESVLGASVGAVSSDGESRKCLKHLL